MSTKYEELLDNATKELGKLHAQANSAIKALGEIDLVYQERCIAIRESIIELRDDFDETTEKIDELENKGSQDWDEWSSVWKDQRKPVTERG